MSNRSLTLFLVISGILLVGCGETKSSANSGTRSGNSGTSSSTVPSTSSTDQVTVKTPDSKTSSTSSSADSPEIKLSGPSDAPNKGPRPAPTVGNGGVESKGLAVGFQGLSVQQLLERRNNGEVGENDEAGEPSGLGAQEELSGSETTNDSSPQTLPSQISLPVTLQAGLPAAAADMVVTYDASLLKFIRARAGKGATAAGKSVLANQTSSGSAKLVIMGLNLNVMKAGDPVAWIDFEVLDPNSSAVPAIRLSNVTIADPSGKRVSGT